MTHRLAAGLLVLACACSESPEQQAASEAPAAAKQDASAGEGQATPPHTYKDAATAKAADALAKDPQPIFGPLPLDAAVPEVRVPVYPRRHVRRVELILRSTPPGATVAVDGEVAGKTPVVWLGKTASQPRDITFSLPGYTVARYRFVVTKSGIVHAQLKKLPMNASDAGQATKPEKKKAD